MTNDIWILGATGRTGRDVAARLDREGVDLVLAGRSRSTLDALAGELGGRPRVSVGSLDENLRRLAQDPPRVVVNTVGPFATTSRQVSEALPDGTHYVDISNEFSGFEDVFGLDERAKRKGQTLVKGAGYGVMGTEAAILRLCEGRPRPARVRVDSLPTLALAAGPLGAALAGSVVEVIRFGGREVRGGSLVRSATASHPRTIVTPEGDSLFTGGGASGDLFAAWRASGAEAVVAASMAAPSNPVVRRVILPILGVLIRIPGAPAFLSGRIAKIKLKEGSMARTATWGHAEAEWPDGTTSEAWLRTGDAGVFTADVFAEVALRLLRGEGKPGAFTPGALFGADLAEAAGATITLV
ncbi:membrane protein [Frondihabitans sucicola]|uniref:Membrane protein n=1 Tax=Frondihabitans sucicola TaxID=1268041 RepID=A0ABM8GUU7_9MICO|nr:membrane protein [Frondihabitans sucicola]BDZ52246.1 membrane protein [Frondihabitans sucicola]